jgi:hypothetical protein
MPEPCTFHCSYVAFSKLAYVALDYTIGTGSHDWLQLRGPCTQIPFLMVGSTSLDHLLGLTPTLKLVITATRES